MGKKLISSKRRSAIVIFRVTPAEKELFTRYFGRYADIRDYLLGLISHIDRLQKGE